MIVVHNEIHMVAQYDTFVYFRVKVQCQSVEYFGLQQYISKVAIVTSVSVFSTTIVTDRRQQQSLDFFASRT